jgi:hypothetical protein
MNLIDRIAEQHIQEAIERGEFDNLPNAGQALELDDDALIPAELRAAYRLLKNAGFLPPELQLRQEINAAEALLLHIDEPDERCRAFARLQVLRTRLEAARGGTLRLDEAYYQPLIGKLARQESH